MQVFYSKPKIIVVQIYSKVVDLDQLKSIGVIEIFSTFETFGKTIKIR
jgi:hypothetical protein